MYGPTTPTKVKDAQPGYVLTYGDDNHWYAAPAAQTYVLPRASDTALGGVKTGFTTDTTNKNYAVVLDNDGKAYVNVPWSGSSYGEGTGFLKGNVNSQTSEFTTSWDNSVFCYRGTLSDNYANGTTYSTINSGTYIHDLSGSTDSIIHFQASGSASGLDIRFTYAQDSSNPLKYRKCVDSSRFSGGWVTLIDSNNIGSQSVNYATSAGSAGSVAWSNVSGRPTAVSSFTNDSGYITSSGSCNYATTSGTATYANSAGSASSAGYATSAGSADSAGWAGGAGYISDGSMDVVAQYNNEVNFGGSDGSAIIYFGYRARGSKGIPTSFIFGGGSGSASITCNYLYANSDVQVTSDERRKDVIGNVELTVEQIAQMPSVLFRWKKGFGDDLIHVGTLAQKWEPVLPAAVGIGTDDARTRSFSYSAAAYAMAHADACEIVALKKRVSELEAELKRYKSA